MGVAETYVIKDGQEAIENNRKVILYTKAVQVETSVRRKERRIGDLKNALAEITAELAEEEAGLRDIIKDTNLTTSLDLTVNTSVVVEK